VHREQHFLARNTGLTCCAAPIFDHRSELVAVLDASGESDRAQQHTLVLVNMSAQMIENRLFLHRFRDAFVVRFHSRPELVGTWSEGIMALDPAGAVVALDRNALFQLGCRQAGDLINAPLERVFNISLSALLGRSRRKSFHPLPVYEARHGGRFFAVAQEPESAAKRVASRDVPILLIGETGTGKELFARALHASSERAEHSFVAVNCAAVPEALLQSEIVQAHGGTLFLNEIGELPAALQARLLHVLEKREMRLIAASRSSLEEKTRRGEFREDLFYRLQGLVLALPRLDERTDKRALIRHVFAQETADTPSVSLGEDLVDALCAHQWRGNIRQLRNALRAMIARRSGDKLDVADLPSDCCPGARPAEPGAAPAETDSLNSLGRAEREALLRELDLEHGNISHLARKLGVGRNTLYRKMRRLHIQWPVSKPLQ
jgi:transcriptional regulator of acetoin/glycerol metabolism